MPLQYLHVKPSRSIEPDNTIFSKNSGRFLTVKVPMKYGYQLSFHPTLPNTTNFSLYRTLPIFNSFYPTRPISCVRQDFWWRTFKMAATPNSTTTSPTMGGSTSSFQSPSTMSTTRRPRITPTRPCTSPPGTSVTTNSTTGSSAQPRSAPWPCTPMSS